MLRRVNTAKLWDLCGSARMVADAFLSRPRCFWLVPFWTPLQQSMDALVSSLSHRHLCLSWPMRLLLCLHCSGRCSGRCAALFSLSLSPACVSQYFDRLGCESTENKQKINALGTKQPNAKHKTTQHHKKREKRDKTSITSPHVVIVCCWLLSPPLHRFSCLSCGCLH